MSVCLWVRMGERMRGSGYMLHLGLLAGFEIVIVVQYQVGRRYSGKVGKVLTAAR